MSADSFCIIKACLKNRPHHQELWCSGSIHRRFRKTECLIHAVVLKRSKLIFYYYADHYVNLVHIATTCDETEVRFLGAPATFILFGFRDLLPSEETQRLAALVLSSVK